MTGSEMNKLTIATMQVEALREQLADAQATVEALTTELAEYRGLAEKVGAEKAVSDRDALLARVEALQRERDEANKYLDQIAQTLDCHRAYIPESILQLDRWLDEREAALDAEREKVKGLEKWRINVTAALLRPGGAFYEDVPTHVKEMAEELTQLQALVREVMNAGVAFEDGRIAYKEVQIDRDWFDRARASLDPAPVVEGKE